MRSPRAASLVHPLALINLRTFAELVRTYGVDRGYRLYTIALFMSCGLGIPFRFMDAWLSSRLVEQSPLPHTPLFIIGHWRSGTTHLHNLLSLDPRFGCLRGIHCVAPQSFLGARRLIGRLLGPHLPAVRPMDNVAFGLDRPQEEEFAMSRTAPMSLFHAFCFPRRMREIFDRWVTFESATEAEIAAWKQTYHWLLRRVSLDEGGRPLCMKSPTHTARLPLLREDFPDARFVHVYRNPHVVYHSNLKMWRAMISAGALQCYEQSDLEENLFYFYRQMMSRLFKDSLSVPENRLIHVRYEGLEADPVGEIKRIYETLELDGFSELAPLLRAYLQRDHYRTDTYSFDKESVERVEREWGFALSRWGYCCPVNSSSARRT